jgi:hypothetical protein
MYQALSGLAPPFYFLLSAFYFGLLVASGGFARPFCIRHSAFNLCLGVALG